MKRAISLLALTALMIAPQAHAGGAFLKTIASAQKKAKEKNQLIFVDLFAEWCGWCHRFEAEVVPSAAFQKATENMILLRLDTEDRKEGTEFAQKYQATSLPTFLILNPDLTIAAVIRGYLPPDRFVAAMKAMLDKHDLFKREAADEAVLAKNYPKRLEIAKEFRTRMAFDESEKRLRKLMTEKGVPAFFRDEAYYELASLYFRQAKYDQALKTIKDFSKLQNQGESLERAKLLVSDVYVAQGNLTGAANELRTFKETYPNSQFVRNVDLMLPRIERQIQFNSLQKQ